MSTEIKNTLFRFVTMRAPELVSDEDKANGFIFHPTNNLTEAEKSNNPADHSHFETEISMPKTTPTLQLTALKAKVASYETAKGHKFFANKAELDTYLQSDLLPLSNQLAKTRKSALDLEEELTELALYSKQPMSLQKAIVVWDNLFYQLITQKNPTLRDTIMQVLIANHYLANPGLKKQSKTAKASIVIPVSFFGSASIQESTDQHAASRTYIPAKGNIELKKALQVYDAQSTIKMALKAKETAQNLEKEFRKSEARRRDVAQKEHAGLLKIAYQNATLEENTFENKVTGETTTKREYKNLEIPELIFEAEPEIKSSRPQDALGRGVFSVIDSSTLQQCQTYSEVYELLDKIIADANNVMAKHAVTTEKVVVIAGVPISMRNSMSRKTGVFPYTGAITYMAPTVVTPPIIEPEVPNVPEVPNTPGAPIIQPTITMQNNGFSMKIISGSNTNDPLYNKWSNLNISIANLREEDLESLDCTFSVESPDGLADDIVLTASNFGDNSVSFTDTSGIIIGILKTAPKVFIKADIALTEGTLSIQIPIIVSSTASNQLYDGVIRTGSGSKTIPEAVQPPTGNVEIDNTTTFIPSRFGIKSLGVADYRKVEQSVCGYEPGEVSHIENIMAREYKEKSTERSLVSDTTTTTSNETEAEKLTDTTTATRYEMHTEVAQILNEDTQIGLGSTFNNQWTGGSVSLSGNFAHNTSQEDSTNQATTYAQDITQRAMERVVSKIKSEKISKVVESYKENNKHGFDNTKGDKHVSGVYRWVNKIYNNQIVNYGKRAMVEFMIPEPARFHILASTKNNENGSTITLEKPIDPRKAESNLVLKLGNDFNARYKHWVEAYNVEIPSELKPSFTIGKSISGNSPDTASKVETFSTNDEIQIPEGYKATSAAVTMNAVDDGDQRDGKGILVSVGNAIFKDVTKFGIAQSTGTSLLNSFENTVPFSFTLGNYFSGSVTVSVFCEPTATAMAKWQTETFNAIIEAYEEKLKEYNKALEDSKSKASEMIASNPLYYRQIERNILKKNIMQYLVNDKYLGQDYLLNGDDLMEIKPNNDETFDNNASVARFMEQAFEWDIISYSFLPFYWGSKDRWKDTYNYQFDDALFTNFMQAGMARVVLTVRPGFEKAVNWYMATGQVWNGGQIPTIGDDLFLSIDQELKDVKPTPEGLPWKTILPSDLTVIQSSTIALDAQGLPCGCPTTVGGQVNLTAKIDPSDDLIGGKTAKNTITIENGVLQYTPNESSVF